ncbi:hypothetical protein [Nonomuraea rubra]|uniref:Uncharacterized protein n=1 Tax=Nonomuraea rubra TaxID=46180 RepID=A0A7X0P0J9_9ACTN|nr:hypothetical protein [Nonomuraea rubra]MBB6553061.1 hypothetical protein [Nonomuraea rubra]
MSAWAMASQPRSWAAETSAAAVSTAMDGVGMPVVAPSSSRILRWSEPSASRAATKASASSGPVRAGKGGRWPWSTRYQP